LVATALKSKDIKYRESDEKTTNNFTCVFRGGNSSEHPDHVLKVSILDDNLIRIAVWALDIKIHDKDAAVIFCVKESAGLKGDHNMFKIDDDDNILLQLIFPTNEADDESVVKAVVSLAENGQMLFLVQFPSIMKFSHKTNVGSPVMTPEKQSEYQDALTTYLRTMQYTKITKDDNAIRFEVPEFQTALFTVTVVKSTSSMFLFVIYKDDVSQFQRSKMITFIRKFNAENRGMLDMNLSSGRLRFVMTAPRLDLMTPRKFAEQTFGTMLRSSILRCRETFADIEELLTGVRPNLKGELAEPEADAVDMSYIPPTIQAPPIVKKPVGGVRLPSSDGSRSSDKLVLKQSSSSGSDKSAKSPASGRAKTPEPVGQAAKRPKPQAEEKEDDYKTGNSSIGSGASSVAKPVTIIESRLISKNRIIGQGGAACVFSGTYCGSNVAIKQLYQDPSLSSEQLWEKIMKEVSIHHNLSHPNVVALYGISYDEEDQNSLIVLEHCANGSLFDTFRNGFWKKRDITERKKIAKDIVTGMIYMHAKGIYHGDLKPHNVLIDQGMTAKIADFGISKELVNTLVTSNGHTLLYCAPEVLKGKASLKSDVYPFAFILMELITMKTPFAALGNTFMKAYEDNWRPNLDIPGVNARMKDLIQRCWSVDPNDRPTFEEILPELEFMDEV